MTVREDEHRGTLYDGEGSAYGHLYNDPGRPKNRAEDAMIALLDSARKKGKKIEEDRIGPRSCLSWMGK